MPDTSESWLLVGCFVLLIILYVVIVRKLIDKKRIDSRKYFQSLDPNIIQECCKLLGVESTATVGEVKRAFRAKARQLHPGNKATGGEESFKKLSTAYEALALGRTGDFGKITDKNKNGSDKAN